MEKSESKIGSHWPAALFAAALSAFAMVPLVTKAASVSFSFTPDSTNEFSASFRVDDALTGVIDRTQLTDVEWTIFEDGATNTTGTSFNDSFMWDADAQRVVAPSIFGSTVILVDVSLNELGLVYRNTGSFIINVLGSGSLVSDSVSVAQGELEEGSAWS